MNVNNNSIINETANVVINTDKISKIIEIQNIKKYFKTTKAVDEISLDIHKGELFSILGPNGAGKSTLIRMLTTILTPTSGDAKIKGESILTRKNEIIKYIGVCPQEIVIYDVLSAEDNIKLMAQMHGIENKKAKEKAQTLLKEFKIDGRKTWAKNLSGGMKRRLNLAMALVFDPEIVFLDEPSAGLDPQARRLVWDYIKSLKNKDNTIILTTHDMVEAESLSDRIAIIDHGKIIAQGTPKELKDGFGGDNVVDITFKSKQDFEIAKASLIELDIVKNLNQFTKKGKIVISISFQGNLKNLMKIIQNGIMNEIEDVENIKFHETSLEDVFLNLTGRRLRD